jgi:GntR family transcriptional regulator
MSTVQAIGSRSIPLYAQVEAALAASIMDGTLAPGTQLPTEAGLTQRFGVSRPTVRKAIQNLANRGLVEVRRGNGTFATQPPLTPDLSPDFGLAHDLDLLLDGPHAPEVANGSPAPALTSRILGQQILPADKTAARELGLSTWDLTVRFDRLRLRDGFRLSVDEIHLPFPLGDGLTAADLEASTLAASLGQKLGVAVVSAKYALQAVPAEPAVAEALDMTAGKPILLIERTVYTDSQRAILYEKLQCRGDLVRLVTRAGK